MKYLGFLFSVILLVSSCNSVNTSANFADAKDFNVVVDGKQVALYTLKNQSGSFVQITNYGGRIVSVVVPDKDGVMGNVVLGFNDLAGYQNANERFISPIVGRVANRIKEGKFTIDSVEYQTSCNNGPNALHGGKSNFAEKVWDVVSSNDSTLIIQYVSPDMDEGFPGTLTATVTYTFTSNNELKINFNATTDKKTVVNLTSHPFFNLMAVENTSVDDHLVYINSDYYVPVDSTLIPTGEFAAVEGTAFDLRNEQPIGERNDDDDIQLTYGGGYDHSWVINRADAVAGDLVINAKVSEPTTGRVLEVYSNQPCVQFYGGNSFKSNDKGRSGQTFGRRTGFAMETQHLPDSPNQPNFPSVILDVDSVYNQTCVYKFSVL